MCAVAACMEGEGMAAHKWKESRVPQSPSCLDCLGHGLAAGLQEETVGGPGGPRPGGVWEYLLLT